MRSIVTPLPIHSVADIFSENCYIPPIVLSKKKDAAGDDGKLRDKYVCVDGKQRLSSVRAFVRAMIPCHDHKGEKW